MDHLKRWAVKPFTEQIAICDDLDVAPFEFVQRFDPLGVGRRTGQHLGGDTSLSERFGLSLGAGNINGEDQPPLASGEAEVIFDHITDDLGSFRHVAEAVSPKLSAA